MKRITLDSLSKLGMGNNMVEDLLDQQVREIEAILGEEYRGMGNKILSMFLQSGNRVQLSEDNIANELYAKKGIPRNKIERVLDQMTSTNLLRKTPGGKYELSNNLLAQRAFQKVEAENRVLRTMRSTIRDRMQRKEFLDEQYLNYITSSLELLELNPEEADFVRESREAIQRNKRRRGYLFVLIFMAITAMALLAWFQSRVAEKNSKKLAQINIQLNESRDSLNQALETEKESANTIQQSLDFAIAEKQRADSLAKVAKEYAAQAKAEAARANENARQAQSERNRAKQEAANAIRSSELARQAEAKATQSAEKAERLRIEAKNAEIDADKARKRAVVFSNAVIALNAALKSQELDDPRLQALVARQAYNIVSSSPELGLTRHPYIYNALYYAVKDVDPSTQFRSKAQEGSIRDIVFQSNGKRFFTTGSDGKVIQWDIDEWNALGVPAHRRTLLPFDGDAVHNSLSLSADEGQLLVGGELNYMQVYNFGNKTTQRIPWPKGKTREELTACHFLNNTGAVAGMGFRHAYYKSGSNAPMRDIPKLYSGASTFLETDRGMIPLSAQFIYRDGDTEFNIEGLINGRMVRQERHTRNITLQSNYGVLTGLAAQQSSGAGLMAFGFQNGQILLGRMDVATLDINNLVPLFKQNQSPIVHLAFSPNGRYLAAASLDGRATLWDLKIYESDPTYQPLLLEDHEGWATSICFSPDERFLLVGTKNGEVAFWNLDPRVYAEHLCNQLRSRYLSPRYDEMESTDWRRFFGTDIKQQKVCGGN